MTLRISCGDVGIQEGPRKRKKKQKKPFNFQTEKQTRSDRDLTRSTCSTQKCVTESGERHKQNRAHLQEQTKSD